VEQLFINLEKIEKHYTIVMTDEEEAEILMAGMK